MPDISQVLGATFHGSSVAQSFQHLYSGFHKTVEELTNELDVALQHGDQNRAGMALANLRETLASLHPASPVVAMAVNANTAFADRNAKTTEEQVQAAHQEAQRARQGGPAADGGKVTQDPAHDAPQGSQGLTEILPHGGDLKQDEGGGADPDRPMPLGHELQAGTTSAAPKAKPLAGTAKDPEDEVGC